MLERRDVIVGKQNIVPRAMHVLAVIVVAEEKNSLLDRIIVVAVLLCFVDSIRQIGPGIE